MKYSHTQFSLHYWCTLFLLCTSFYLGHAQCPPGDVMINSQADLNAFATNYPTCTIVNGSININSTNITDLTPLSNLTSIEGDFFLWGNNNLTNLDGLEALTSIGGWFRIQGNSSLTSIESLSNLTSIEGRFIFYDNDALTNADGLSNLSTVGSNINIFTNAVMANIDGLSGLTYVGGRFRIGSNSLLLNLNGLSSLASVGGNLEIFFNGSLINLDGLSNLTSLEGDLAINNNPNLTNLDGLCPLFETGYDLGNFTQGDNGTTIDPEIDCNLCAVESVSIASQSSCNSFYNTYTQNLEITYSGAPETGMVNVNGQLFPIETSPQTVTLIDLPANGQAVDLSVFFTDKSDCSWEEIGSFTAPGDCSLPCDITALTAGDPYNCNPISDTYSRDLMLSYEGTNLTGTIEVLVEGQGGFMSYPILYTSPQVITLDGLPSNGEEIDVFVKFSDESGCSINMPALFTNPQNCTGPTGDCDITSLTAGVQSCDESNNTYDQEIILTYNDAPTSGSILVKVDNGDWLVYPVGTSPQTLLLEDLTPGEGDIDIFIKFSDASGCTMGEDGLFTAPEDCTPPVGGGNVLFVVADAGSLRSGDAEVKAQLEGLGHSVMVMSDEHTQSNSANGKSLVVISNTVSSGQIVSKFTHSSTPVICYETYLYDDLGMTNSGGYGHDNGEIQVEIQAPGHQLSAGFNGFVNALNASGQLAYGYPNGNAVIAASTDGSSAQATVFGYESGANMVSGTAPARRVGIFLKDSEISKLTANGWKFFDEAVCWAMGWDVARFAPEVTTLPQIRAYPNPTLDEVHVEWEIHAQEVQLSLKNILGQEVMNRNVWFEGRYRLDMGHLSEGIYVLQVVSEQGRQEVRIVKE